MLRYPITIRTPPRSDPSVFDQIFVQRHYRCLDDLRPRTILDLGANVGLSSVWFISRCPKARIIAVEPDPRNFKLLKQNCAQYPGIIPILGAVWSECCRLKLVRGEYLDGGDWATQVAPAKRGCVQGFDIPALMHRSGLNSIDLLKIDIERADVELFRHGTAAWLPSVRNICIELHDRECEDIFFSALEPYTYDMSLSGELTICRNLRSKARPRTANPRRP
jgi:FkbM family methyltransferase